ncbi:MAG: SDR family oxidoreductase, partial [Pseudomonadota bacterium]
MAHGDGNAGRVAVITGAGSGIGAATAAAFLEAGWRVALLGRRAAPLEAVAAGRPGARAIPCDVADPADVETAFARINAEFGRVDMLFNNAGIGLPGATVDAIDPADWARVVGVNLTGAFLCARAAFGAMRAQHPRGGRIINNGSVSAYAPRP